jgi:xanthine dehydrogenase molybdenum-binding subunit
MPDFKLIGKDFAPPDLEAKITGRAKYAEDFRAEGMLFAKLLVSPMPHCRVVRIDASAALAMPGVEAILTADDLPEGRDAPNDERALTNEPLYEGEPILAVAAVDETTAADAIDKIRVELEPLPFVIDPLESLRPGGPDARIGGNTGVRGEDRRTVLQSVKWPQDVWDQAGEDGFPMGEPADEWTIGDIDAGFAEADVIIDESVFHQSQTHHPLEPRSCMAYWQNGKLYAYVSTQSVARTVASLAGGVGIDPSELVLVSEYCGGGFGSKISGSVNMPIPALLSRKTGRPVMLRVTRAEENYFGRARPGFQARIKLGMRADGRVTAIDMFIVQDNGPYGLQGDHSTAGNMAHLTFQPENMRWRGITVFTNTPPRGAQRGPGGVQVVAMITPLVDRACRQLGIDRVDMLRANLPGHDAVMGPRLTQLSSCFVREALDLGAERFDWASKNMLSRQRNGTKVTGIGLAASPYTAGSFNYDGLAILTPEGRLRIHQGIGNLGTHSIADTGRAAAEPIDMPWDRCDIVWGDTSKHLPWSSSQAGSQTTHAHTRANYAAGLDLKRKLQEIAARDLGGAPESYEVAAGRVFNTSDRSRSMSLPRAATRAIELGGRYDGHELPEDINEMTVASATALAGQGLMGVARDNFDRGGPLQSWVIGFARVEVDVETGMVDIVEYLAATDCGTVLNPRSLGAQLHGGSIQGFGVARSQKWVYDPQWGVPFTKGFHTAKPPTILDVPLEMDWVAADLPDPYNPVGCKGIGEPPMGAGAGAIVSAIEDALGGDVAFNRTPITTDMILAALERRPQPYRGLTAHV